MQKTIRIFLCMVSAVLLVKVKCLYNSCPGKEDGAIVEISCTSYKVCRAGQPVSLSCPEGYFLDRDSEHCFLPGSGKTACGLPADCSGKDGLYPDVEFGCKSFISCAEGTFAGRLYCPANLVYNQNQGACDYPQNVEFPCGPKDASFSSLTSYDDHYDS